MKIRGRQRGQSMIEFGIIALLFVGILFAIADFGMLLNGWVAVSSATREAGRRASLGQQVGDVTDAARKFAPIPGVPPNQVKVVIQYCNAGDFSCAAPLVTMCDSPTPGFTCYSPWNPGYPGTTPPTVVISPNFVVKLTVVADTFEVITPLVRPFFTHPTRCANGSAPHCYVPITSSITMRYEGAPPP